MKPTERQEADDLRVELDRAERRVDALKSIGRAMGAGLDLDSLLTRIVDQVTKLLDAERSSLFLVDPDRNELWSKVLQGSELAEIRLPVGRGLAGWVARHGRPICTPDAYLDERFNPDVDRQTGFRTRSALVWPLRRPADRQLTGVLQVLNKTEGETFDGDDERLVEAIASEIAMALDAARLYDDLRAQNRELERTRRELEFLFETEKVITQAPDVDSMLASILDTAGTYIDAQAGILWIDTEDDAGIRLSAQLVQGLDQPPGRPSSLVKRVVDEDRPVRVVPRSAVKRGERRVRSILAVPIRTRYAGVIGALELIGKRSEAGFDEADERALQAVADQAGRAITAERRRVEREQSDRLSTVGRMLSGIVHDLRTPLTLIAGYADRLVTASDREEREGFADKIRRQVDQIARMTREVLAFSRGERRIFRRRIRLEAFDREMAEYLKHEFDGHDITLELDLTARGEAWLDDGKLRRVFANVARNAREAMLDRGTFRVRSARRGDRITYEFRDSGPGIPNEIRDRLFEPFASANKEQGTGLGLAMVKQIVDDHDGSVEVESRPGQGARFRIVLPLVDPSSD